MAPAGPPDLAAFMPRHTGRATAHDRRISGRLVWCRRRRTTAHSGAVSHALRAPCGEASHATRWARSDRDVTGAPSAASATAPVQSVRGIVVVHDIHEQ